ncbi:HEAT repeat domain-containing protein [Symmachiella macrocystis]|nr:HEAT repeat domain-containing protein [Symmachiella macrocystis]
MDSDPGIQIPEPVKDIHPNLTTLWLEALNRPEIDMQRMAAESIARASQRDIPGLDKAVPRLEEILVAEESHPTARYAAARALIALDSRASSDKLLETSQSHGADLAQLIEPALAAWENPAAKTVWVERLAAKETGPRNLVLAMRGLGELQHQSALPSLVAIANDLTRTSAVRLEAATAAGKIAESGLEQDAERLAGDTRSPRFINQFCAIRLLAGHSSAGAKKLITELADHDEPAIAAAALKRLNEIDYALVLPMAEEAMQSPDPEVRRLGALSMLQLPAVDHIVPLSKLMADPHPGVRSEISEGLLKLSEKPDLNEPIRAAAMQVLAEDRWQGQEQASLLLGALEHKPAADRFIELMESPRVEVRLPATWALRKLAVPETIPALIAQASELTQRRKSTNQPGMDEQVAHLFEALGALQAKDATPLLVQYIPKRVRMNNLSRGSAIWALGRINEGSRDEKLEDAFTDRILDFEPRPSEVSLVKQMSAIALARMQAVDHAPMLRRFALDDSLFATSGSDDSGMRLRMALLWAVKELTGDELPTPKPMTIGQDSWFLEPLP